MKTEEFKLQDWKVVETGDELASDSEANLNASEHTMYHLNADQDIVGDSDWDVAIDIESNSEATVYRDGRIAYAQAENHISEDILAHGAVIDVGEEITSQLISYMEDDAEALEHEGDYLRINTPPRMNAFRENRRRSIPVEDTATVGVQTEDEDVAERYHKEIPDSAADVLDFVANSYVNTVNASAPEAYFT